jgi:hypothetical protein
MPEVAMERLRSYWLDTLATCVAAVGLAVIYAACMGFISGPTSGPTMISQSQTSIAQSSEGPTILR